MRHLFKHEGLYTFLASLLILLFIYTATSKMITRDQFESVLAKMPLIGSLSTFLSYTIPAVEVVISLLLLWPATRVVGFGLSFLLLLLFTCYLGLMVSVAPELPCSCGGVVGQLGWEAHILFNVSFLLAAWAGWKNRKIIYKPFNDTQTFYSNKPTAGGRQA